MSKKKYACPCCGNLTLESQRDFDICLVCFWEDDDTQFADRTRTNGANVVSLDEARKNYKEFGACQRTFIGDVRKPTPEELPS